MTAFIFAAVVAWVFHFIWETAHVPLYTGYDKLNRKIPITVYATMGDVAYTVGALLLVMVFKQDTDWILFAQPADYLGLAILGFFIALFVEYKALALNRWKYLPTMPIIPKLNVGLSPVVQMTLLLPISVALVSWYL